MNHEKLSRQDKEKKFSTKTWSFYPEVNTERTIKQAYPMCPIGNTAHASQVSYEQGSTQNHKVI